jgi:hypothetical protein
LYITVLRIIDRTNWLNLLQVNTTGYNAISKIEALLQSQATSAKSVVTTIDAKIKQALGKDIEKGLEVLQNLANIYSGDLQNLVQGMSRTLSEGAGLILEVQIIIHGLIQKSEAVEEWDYAKIRSLSVSVGCYSCMY